MYYTPVDRKDTKKMVWFFDNVIVPKVVEKSGEKLSHTLLIRGYLIKQFGLGNDIEKYSFDVMYRFINEIKEFFEL